MQPENRDPAIPRFFMEPVQNMALSAKEGRPIFEDKELIEIRIPGDKNYSWVGPVTEQMLINGRRVDSRERFAEQYAAFKRGEQTALTGTPLEQWPNPTITASRVLELKALHIFSVEDLASVSDANLGKLGSGASRELRDQAKAYIDKAKGGAEVAKMAAELATLKELVARLSGAMPVEPFKFDDSRPPLALHAPGAKLLEDCTDEELKAFIKRETGSAPRGNPKRETLLAKAAEIAQKAAA